MIWRLSGLSLYLIASLNKLIYLLGTVKCKYGNESIMMIVIADLIGYVNWPKLMYHFFNSTSHENNFL